MYGVYRIPSAETIHYYYITRRSKQNNNNNKSKLNAFHLYAIIEEEKKTDVLVKEGGRKGRRETKYTIFDVILQIDVWIYVEMFFIWIEHDSSVCRLNHIRSNSCHRSFVIIFFFLHFHSFLFAAIFLY